jgi:hypothetical protein
MRRLWRAYVRLGAFKERVLRSLVRRRMHFVHYSWPLRSDICPCDVHFCEFLEERGIRRKSIFHFGSGGHHIVGLRNHSAGLANEVLALTLSPPEHASYVGRVIADPTLGGSYKVLFADIYRLSAASLPCFDLINLFHLAEFAPSVQSGGPADNREVLRLFCAKLSPGGLILFYKGSFGYPRVRQLLADAEAEGAITYVEDYKSLIIFQAPGSQ